MDPNTLNNKVTNPIVNLNLLDEQIDQITGIINSEIAKGAKADTALLLRMIITVTSYLHNNETVLNRIEQKISSTWIDENYPRFVDLKKNTATQWLSAGGGAVGMAGTLFTTTVLIAAALAGAPADQIAKIMQAPQLIFDGISRALDMYSRATSAGDAARPMQLEHLIQTLQRQINESQSQAQNAKGYETEAMRLLKELLEAEKQYISTLQRGLSVNG